MKEQIFDIIKMHPGISLRNIAYYVNVWHLNKLFLKAINELEMVDNKIYTIPYSDHANMEFYNKYYVKEI